MITLSNVHIRAGGSHPASDLSRQVALPEAMSRKGVSVRYAPSPDKSWYVFRASYGREYKAADIMIEDGTYAYVACRYVKRKLGGKLRLTLESLVPNLVFAYTSADQAKQYVRHTPSLSYLEFYYDHLSRNADGFNSPLIVPAAEMTNFILATYSHNEHVLVVTPSQCHFKSGDRVRVNQGAFCGVEGLVARVAGQQRVVLSLTGLGLVSTAYIPSAFIETID